MKKQDNEIKPEQQSKLKNLMQFSFLRKTTASNPLVPLVLDYKKNISECKDSAMLTVVLNAAYGEKVLPAILDNLNWLPMLSPQINKKDPLLRRQFSSVFMSDTKRVRFSDVGYEDIFLYRDNAEKLSMFWLEDELDVQGKKNKQLKQVTLQVNEQVGEFSESIDRRLPKINERSQDPEVITAIITAITLNFCRTLQHVPLIMIQHAEIIIAIDKEVGFIERSGFRAQVLASAFLAPTSNEILIAALAELCQPLLDSKKDKTEQLAIVKQYYEASSKKNSKIIAKLTTGMHSDLIFRLLFNEITILNDLQTRDVLEKRLVFYNEFITDSTFTIDPENLDKKFPYYSICLEKINNELEASGKYRKIIRTNQPRGGFLSIVFGSKNHALKSSQRRFREEANNESTNSL